VSALVHAVQEPGFYSVQFDGSRLSSGMYICRMQAGLFTAVKSMMLVK
jgi:hypothetical protein